MYFTGAFEPTPTTIIGLAHAARQRNKPLAARLYKAAADKLVVSGKKTTEVCGDKYLADAVKAGLNRPDSHGRRDAVALATSVCSDNLREDRIRWMSAKGGYAQKALCPELLMLKRLSPFQAAYCKDVVN